MWKPALSIIIFVVSYLFIATEKINKTVVAIIGASLALMLQLLTFEQAIASVDFNVVFLLVGMMTCVYILSKTGFFEGVAIYIAKLGRGNPLIILLLLLFATALLSAFLDNVTTIILLVPVTILIMQLLEISPVPFVIMEAIASNIGGTGTLIGDPPNIIIGSQANLSFNDFLIHLGPVVILIFVVFLLTVFLFFKKRLFVSEEVRYRVTQAYPHLAILDKRNLKISLIVLGGIFLGFFLHNVFHIEPGVIALCGSMVMLLACKVESEETFMRVEWGVIFFFIGMFIIIAAMEHNGIINIVAEKMVSLSGKNLFLACMIVLWGSALFSSVLDNIPFVITMIPFIQKMLAHFEIQPAFGSSHPLWWSLALGACLGGNGTLIGASANIVMAQISEKNKYPVRFVTFCKYGVFFTVQSLLLATFYLYWRYF